MTGAVLEEYSKVRNKDAEAICDMSMDNYLEVLYTNCGVKPIITIIWQQTNAYKNWLKIIEYLFSYSLTLKYMFIHRNNCSFITLHLWLSDFLGFYFVTVKTDMGDVCPHLSWGDLRGWCTASCVAYMYANKTFMNLDQGSDGRLI